MKSIKTLLLVGGIFSMTLVSCKKDLTCECTENYEGASTSWSKFYSDTVITYSKKKGEEACDELDGEMQTYGTESYWLDCELK